MRPHSSSKDARGIARSSHRPRLGQDRIDCVGDMYVLYYGPGALFCAAVLMPLYRIGGPHHCNQDHLRTFFAQTSPASVPIHAQGRGLGWRRDQGVWGEGGCEKRNITLVHSKKLAREHHNVARHLEIW